RYFKKHFGRVTDDMFLPDVFGYAAALPQILDKFGIKYFCTQKISWNDTNKFQHNTFWWQGIDGTKILTHWMAFHYDSFSGSPSWYDGFCTFAEKRYKMLKKYAATKSIASPEGGDFTFPVRHDTQYAKQWNKNPGRAFDLIVGTPGDFFKEVLKEKDTLKIVIDDFNPVFQGCYSARIAGKQTNRRLENLLYDTEAWNGFSRLLGGSDMSRSLHDAWEPVLFNQVHDVIGGVQMDNVNKNVQKRYFQAENLVKLSLEDSLDNLVRQIDTRGDGIPLVVFNSLSWERTDKVTIEVAFDTDDVFSVAVANSKGCSVPLQTDVMERYPNGAIRQASLLIMAVCPPTGYEVYRVLKNTESPWQNPFRTGKRYGMEELDEGVLENEYFILKVDLWKGCITSLILKETGAELIDTAMPFGNMLVSDEDNGDFWEIGTPLRAGQNRPSTLFHPLDLNKTNTENSTQKGGTFGISEGNVCTEFTFSQKVTNYDFVTHVRLFTGLARVEIETSLTNRVKNVRYRVAFPTAIRNGKITQEIPFGSLERPEGEYPAINWADYAEPGRGLGVLNCGLPGNATVDSKMMLSVMKCTSFVSYGDCGGFSMDNSSEGGHEINVPHSFRYAVVPHKGDWREALQHRQGAEFNHPLTVQKAAIHGGILSPSYSFLGIDNNQVMVSAVMARGKDLIVRVYEATGKPAANVRATLGWAPVSIEETNMLEEPMVDFEPINIDGMTIIFNLKPYEVRTFRIRLS
ncbi:MAG: glycoside hydrolase family 38 C-terminal domain-containing protein, partial [Eubacteriales bacterium]